MNKRKRFIALLLCVLLTICALPLTALAAYAPVGTEDEPSSVRLYEYYNSEGNWVSLSTPHHWNTQTGEIAYCLEHKNGTPRGDTYSSFDPTDAYPYAVYQGIYSILTFGYPAGGTGGLSAEQARYATANAIRFWLSESQEVYGMDFQQYNFTNLTRSNQYTRPKSGNSTAAAMWAYSMDLLNKARNGTTLQHSIQVNPSTINMTQQGSYFVGQTRVSLTNCNGGYTYDAPYGVQISGFAGNDGDVLTISVPTSMAGQQLSITFTGYDSRSTANYAWYAPSNNDQKVVMVGNGLELPAVTTRLTLIMPDSGGIEIYKTGDNGAALAGAVFGVKDASSRQIGTITTNSRGYGSMDGLDPGTYYVQEISAPSGYNLDPTVHTVNVSLANTATLSLTNSSIKGYIAIKKTNADPTKGSYPLTGAVFTIYSGSTPVDTVTIAADGTGKSKALPLGTYTVREITAPQGFVAAADQTVNITAANAVNGVVNVSITVPNMPQMGKVRVQKTNADDSLGSHSLAGAVFEVRDSAGTLVDTITTDNTGKAESKELVLGTYSVNEITAPNGFVLNSTPKNVTISYGSQTAAVIYGDVNIPNKPQAGQITVQKTNADSDMGDYALSGAVFEIYSGDTVVDTLTTDADGKAVSKLLPLGAYIIKEKAAPEGFVLNTAAYDVELDYAGQTIEVVYESVTVPNKPQTGTITITKRDAETGAEPQGEATLDGAVFEILDTEGNVLHTLTADTDMVTSPELPLGSYVVREKTPPLGYTLNENEYPVVIEYAGQTVEIVEKAVTVENTVIRGRISIIKYAEFGYGSNKETRPLAGTEFTITRKADGELIETLTTDASGYAMSDTLLYGTYTVTEIKGIDSHKLVEPFDVTIDVDEKVFAYALEDEAFQSEVKIAKLDAETGKIIPAAGVQFRIKDADGNWVVQRQLYPSPVDITVFETAADGTLVLPEPLPITDQTISTAASASARMSGLIRGLLGCKRNQLQFWFYFLLFVDAGLEHTDVRQVAVLFIVVEAVAHHELVRHREALVVRGDVGLAAAGLVEDGADLHRVRVAHLEHGHKVGQGDAGVEDVLYDEHILAGQVAVQVFDDLDETGAGGVAAAIAGHHHKVDVARDGHSPHQVGHKDHRPLEDGDEDKVLALVVPADLSAQLCYLCFQFLFRDEDLHNIIMHGHDSIPPNFPVSLAAAALCPARGQAHRQSPRRRPTVPAFLPPAAAACPVPGAGYPPRSSICAAPGLFPAQPGGSGRPADGSAAAEQDISSLF